MADIRKLHDGARTFADYERLFVSVLDIRRCHRILSRKAVPEKSFMKTASFNYDVASAAEKRRNSGKRNYWIRNAQNERHDGN